MTLPCLTCGDDIRLVSLSPVTYGHVAIRRNGDKHPARPPRMRTEPESSWNVPASRAARNAVPAATGLHVSEDAQPLTSLTTNGTRAASKGRPRTAVPSGVTSSPARAGRVAAEIPPAPAPRSARAGVRPITAGEGGHGRAGGLDPGPPGHLAGEA